MEFFLIKILFVKTCKLYKLFRILGTGCYNINVTFISSPKDGLLKLIKFEFRHVDYKVNALFLITFDHYDY